MRALSLRSSLTLAAFCAVASRPAAAQQSAVAELVRPIVHVDSAAGDVDLPRTVAVYKFGGSRNAGIPTQVTVADSSGMWVATYRLPGSDELYPMAVDTQDGGLILRAETSAGLLTLELYQVETDAAGAVLGRWSIGSHEGELLRRVKR